MKKFLSLLLAAMMILSVMPVTALADGMEALDLAPVGEVLEEADPSVSNEVATQDVSHTVEYDGGSVEAVEIGTCRTNGGEKLYLAQLPYGATNISAGDMFFTNVYPRLADRDTSLWVENEGFLTMIEELNTNENMNISFNDGFTLPTTNVKGFFCEAYYSDGQKAVIIQVASSESSSGEGWDGTTVTEPAQADGVYQIGTAEELAWFAAKVNDGTAAAANAVLTADIDLNNKEWTPIGNVPNRYVGNFNGQNHTVKNMSITVGAEYIGLFGFAAKRTIENITVEGKIDIKDLAASVKCGGLIGYLCSDIYDGDETAAGKVINCVSKVDITVSGSLKQTSNFGGLIGSTAAGAKVIGCAYKGNIYCGIIHKAAQSWRRSVYVAGIVGNANDSIIENCYNNGTVIGKVFGQKATMVCGGISNFVGISQIQNCYSTGEVSAEAENGVSGCTLYCGGVLGYLTKNPKDAYPANCNYLEGTSLMGIGSVNDETVDDATSGFIAKSEAEMKSGEFLAQLNSATSITGEALVWVKGANGYPEVRKTTEIEGIQSFVVAGIEAIIDQAAYTITAELPEGTDITSIAPTIVCFGGAVSEPASGVAQDFTNPVIYRVGNLTYTVTLTVKEKIMPNYKMTITANPANAAVSICDADGTIVSREADGSYILDTDAQYNWNAAAKGYAVQSGIIHRKDGKDYNLTVTLKKANGKKPGAVSAEWPSFRGNANNMAIVSTKLPRTASEAAEKWTKALGSGFAAAPSVQIIVDDSLVVMSGKNIYKLSMADGEILAQGKMVKAIDWGYTPATYANGMIFAPLTDGTVQAFDAKTLESLWVYSDPLKGQALSPITYSDGYIYTGFWNSETKDAAYVCIPVTDEDAENATEAQKALWRDIVKGGFYWAGSVVAGDYVVYGTDDATYGSAGTAKILSRNKLTGELMDVHDIVGDQRSSIAYADGKVYFTTKAGYLYSAELGKDGKLNNLKGKNYTEYGLMSTSTPVVYNGYVYFGIAKANFSAPYNTMMVDANTLDVAASVAMQGYPQCSMLLSTAYEKSTGKIYLYSTYNNNPGGITAIEVDQAAKTMTATEIYTPSHPQYCITSLICDGEGTIYYKNDSGYLFAVKLADSVFVKDVEDLINAIGKVEFTDESKGKIDAARAAYDKLTDAQKKLVKNIKVLTDAEAEYERLKKAAEDEAAAKAVDDLIAAIGKVEFTDASKAKIDAARAAYDKLTDAQKKLVKNLKVLTDAEAEYQRLLDQHKADEAAAKAVDEAVAKLTPVTLNSGNAIKAARKAFDELTPAQRNFLAPETESKLKAAEAEYARLVKDAADKAAAKEVEDKIARLQPVTKDSGEAIKDARSSYEALTPEQKALVSKDSVAALDKAEKVYDMIIASTKPGTAVGDNTGSTSGSGVIKITANAAAKGEQNPHTGAPVMSMAPAVLVLAAAALVLKKHK